MPIEDFIIAAFCCIGDEYQQLPETQHLRLRGFSPQLNDSEVLTMEIVGEFLVIDDDKPLWEYFDRHWHHFFRYLGSRSNFLRQAAHLWWIKQALQTHLAERLGVWQEPLYLFDAFRCLCVSMCARLGVNVCAPFVPTVTVPVKTNTIGGYMDICVSVPLA